MCNKLPAISDNTINENIKHLLTWNKEKFLIFYINGQEIKSKVYVVKWFKKLSHFIFLSLTVLGLENLIW